MNKLLGNEWVLMKKVQKNEFVSNRNNHQISKIIKMKTLEIIIIF